MRKLVLLGSAFVFVLTLTLSITLTLNDQAQAVYCDLWVTPYLWDTGVSCTTEYGNPGSKVYRCEGWLLIFGEYQPCACIYYGCLANPKPNPIRPVVDP